MSTMFEDPSFFTKESQGQLNNVDILAHANISEININNTYEFFKELCGDASSSRRH